MPVREGGREEEDCVFKASKRLPQCRPSGYETSTVARWRAPKEPYFTPEIDLSTLAPSAPLATGKREGAADYETFRLKLFRYGKV